MNNMDSQGVETTTENSSVVKLEHRGFTWLGIVTSHREASVASIIGNEYRVTIFICPIW